MNLAAQARHEAGGDFALLAGGDIVFEAVKDFEQQARHRSSSDWAWRSAKGAGFSTETVRMSELIAAGEVAIRAAGNIRIDVPEINRQTVSQTIDQLVEQQPQLAWLKEMDARGDIDWRRVKEQHDRFKYSDSGMGAGLAVVNCPSVVCTNGAAIAWASTDPADQAALRAYEAAAGRQTIDDMAKLATIATAVSPIGVGRLTVGSLLSWRTPALFAVGAGFQSAGDYYKYGEVIPGNSLIAGTTTTLAAPLMGGSIMINSLIGGATLGTNAMAQNALLGANESVALNYGLGLGFTGFGTVMGRVGTAGAQQFMPQWVRTTPLDPALPALLQAPAMFNPRPGQVGATFDTFISNVPVFLETSTGEGAQP